MKSFASKFLWRFAAFTGLVVIVLTTLLAGRLMTGPVSLGPLTTYVERNLNETLEGLQVEVGDLVVRWSAAERDLQIRLVDVLLQADRGSTVAKVPEMEVALSAIGVVRGVIAPTRIQLIGPSATIIRRNDGSFNVGVGGEDVNATSAADETKPILERVMELFLANKAANDPGAYLHAIEITNAKLVFYDQPSRTYWQAPDAVLGLRKQKEGISGYVSAALDFGGDPWRLDVSGFLDPATKFLDIEGQFESVVLSKLQSVGEGFDIFKGVNLPLSGTYTLVMKSDGELVTAEAELSSQMGAIAPPFFNGDALNVETATADIEFDASTGRVLIDHLQVQAVEGSFGAVGTLDLARSNRGALKAAYFDVQVSDIWLNLPNVFTEPGGVDHLALRGRWASATDKLEIESAFLRAGDSNLQVSGLIEDFGTESPPIKLEGQFTKFDVDRLPSLWPIRMANGAHDWVVANLKDGQLYDGKLVVDLPAGALDNPKLPDEALRLDFSYSGITARYINGLPPIKRGKGNATLFGDRFELNMSGGATGDMNVSNGRVVITELHRKPSLGNISVLLSGDTSELLRILDMEPLGYPSDFGVDPESVGGTTVLKLEVALPMIRDLAFRDVDFDGQAALSRLSIPDVINDVGVDDGAAEIKVTNTHLDAIGVLNIGTLDVSVTWREDFETTDLSTEIMLTSNLDGADAKVFGVDLTNVLMSDARVELNLQGNGQDVKLAMLEADFTNAVIDIGEMGWRKQAGRPARGQIEVEPRASGGWDFKRIDFDAEDSSLRGRVEVAPSGIIEKAEFDTFKLGEETDAVIDYTNSPRATALSVKGEALNISGLIDRILENTTSSTEEADRFKSLDVELSLDELTLANGVILKDVKGELHDSGGRIEEADFEGSFVDGGVVFAKIEAMSEFERGMRLTASDAGKLLRGVDFTDQLLDGRLNVFAKLTELANDEPVRSQGDGTDFSLVTNGELSIENFRVVNAPILAQLLIAGSPQGAQDLLNRDGIGFDRFFVPFMIKNGRISFDRSQALGPAIGITVGGSIDQNDDTLDLTGTIVPSYSINSAIGYVPVVGQLLVSRDGEGLFAFTYNIEGPVEEPRIAVNPLSGLAPGFLRRIFQIGQNGPIVPKIKPGEP